MVVVILDPPAAPVTNLTFPVDLLTIIAGLIDDLGRFPGFTKFGEVWKKDKIDKAKISNFAI